MRSRCAAVKNRRVRLSEKGRGWQQKRPHHGGLFFCMLVALLAKESLHKVEDRADGLLSRRARLVFDRHLCEVE